MSKGRRAQSAQRRQGRTRRLSLGTRVTLAVIGALFAAAGPAAAYFSVGVTTTGNSAAIADSLNAGHTPTLGGINGENVTLNWGASTIVHGGQSATGYTMTRYNAATGGTATPATGGCAGTVSALTCTEQNVTLGNWWYTVTPKYDAWAGVESGRLAVTVTAPAFSITSGQSSPTTGGSITGGAVSHFGNSENVTFHLDSAGGTVLSTSPGTVTTNGSGSATITNISIPSGVSAGTHSIVAVGATSGLTATSNTFSVFGTATKLVLAAQTTTPTAGVGDNLTITAEDSGGNTVTGYNGSKNLTFSGASLAPNGTTHPTVSNSSGTAVSFGSTTAITFTNGVAQASGSNNGVMTLYDAQTASIVVSDGTINNGTGLSVTVAAAGPASTSLANCAINGSSTTCGTSFALSNSLNVTANVDALDQYGNGAKISSTITMSVSCTAGTCADFSVTGSPLTIDGSATPAYQSTTQLMVRKTASANASATVTVHVTSSPSLPDLTFTVTK